MLHPDVLREFDATKGEDLFGLVDVEFPNMLAAARWVQIWTDEAGKEPDVSLMSHGTTLQRPVIVTVRGG